MLLLVLASCAPTAFGVDVPLESFVPEERWAELGLPSLTEPQRKALASEFQRVHLEGYASGTRSPQPGKPATVAPAANAEDPVAFLAIRSTVEGGVKKPYIASTHASKRIAYVVERRKQGIDHAPAMITGQLEPEIINGLGDATYAVGNLRYPYVYRVLSAQFVANP
ncbi:MAG TPA: hypothetical protein VJM11_00220 [Nevskiaceae bacterium]|nr:hypothetical protein [Nevskiaceae bacterium]